LYILVRIGLTFQNFCQGKRRPAAAAPAKGRAHAEPRAGVPCFSLSLVKNNIVKNIYFFVSIFLSLSLSFSQAIAEANRRMAGGGTIDPDVQVYKISIKKKCIAAWREEGR
jgi:hypothetical protein